VLLLCEKNSTSKHFIEHLELDGVENLEKIDFNLLRSPKKQIDFKNNKWTFYFLDQNEIDFLEALTNSKRIPQLKTFADVEVGITTGGNDFFTVPKSTVDNFDLQEYARPMVGRSVQVSSMIFTEKDWQLNRDNEAKAHLLVFSKLQEMKGNHRALKYLEDGENSDIHKGYKCRIRNEWQIVPSVKISDALFIRRNHLFPKLVDNRAKAYTTDTMHRVFIKKEVNKKAFIASYYNSLSFAFAEIVGRSYGGGVLELMPNETEEILLPYDRKNENILNEIDIMMRSNKSIDEILKYSDEIILRKGFDLSSKEIKMANNIWKKLSARRLNRK
jgi:adenine-specific DNA methylase